MTTYLVIIALIFFLVFCFAVYFIRKTPSVLRSERRIVYADHMRFRVTRPLYSNLYRIAGMPDRVVNDKGKPIPCEFKSGDRPPINAWPQDEIQAIAQMVLVEEYFRIPPPYALIFYKNGDPFVIKNTEENRQRLVDAIEGIRSNRFYRNHNNRNKCRSCFQRERCTERL